MERSVGVDYSAGLSKALAPLYLFGSIGYWAELLRFSEVTFEIHENFIKQSPRSRYSIYGPQGKQNLSVLLSNKSSRIPFKDIKLSYDEPWNVLHWRSLETAYGSSPFFEFYKDELKPIYNRKWDYLIDLNIAGIELIISWLNVDIWPKKSERYMTQTEGFFDLRTLDKKEEFSKNLLPTYNQVFMDQGNPFIPNLSILDLIFNHGPESISKLLFIDN